MNCPCVVSLFCGSIGIGLSLDMSGGGLEVWSRDGSIVLVAIPTHYLNMAILAFRFYKLESLCNIV